MPATKRPPKKRTLPSKTASGKLILENEQLRRERDEALEREGATSDVLRMIARSPADLQSVIDAIAEKAARVCDATDAAVWRVDGDVLRLAAHFGPIPLLHARGDTDPVDRNTVTGRAVSERRTIHVDDLLAAKADFPRATPRGLLTGTRTSLAAPLLRDGTVIGAIHIRRGEVRPFTDRQIRLLETFADQAVIAIENVRLFNELKESLEQQTATSEILSVIASSPTNIQPVLDVVAENAARLCEANDAQIRLVEGDGHRLVASFGSLWAPEFRITGAEKPFSRALLTRETVHVHDLQEIGYPSASGTRTLLSTPMLREGTPIGLINIRRTEARPFSDRHIKLLETFASQAVIAIENVRLFKELQERNRDLTEALEQQTATSEVLRVIASSPTELQPVLDTLIANAVKLSGATQGHIRQYDGELLRPVAHYGESPEQVALLQRTARKPVSENTTGRAFLERKPVHILDAQLEPGIPGLALRNWARTMLAVPLLREGTPIGVITIWRDFVEAFTERQIDLVKTFADQAVIAIENVRLFQELKESLEQQTATSEVLGVIASSPTDIQPVLEAVAENAARLCDASDAHVLRINGDRLVPTAAFGPMPLHFPGEGLPISRGLAGGRAVIDRQTVHVHDMAAELDTEFPDSKHLQALEGFRTILATPLLRENFPLGSIVIRRKEARPFSEKQIALLKTFADQAVIAIENVRLFKELQDRNRDLTEALEQQTATSEVLRVIASSPTELQPVLDTLIANAVRLSGATRGHVRQFDGEFHRVVAHYGETAEMIAILRANPLPASPELPACRWQDDPHSRRSSGDRCASRFGATDGDAHHACGTAAAGRNKYRQPHYMARCRRSVF